MTHLVKKLSLFSILVCLCIAGEAQEVLSEMSINPSLTSVMHKKAFKTVSTTLQLPFFDDFSGTSVYPNENIWNDQYVFINSTYGQGMPTVGVATFDAVSQNGSHYPNASSSPFSADTLTSKPIDISKADTNSTYLSFYYQPQGLGNSPEFNDSLVLEFSGDNSNWHRVWYANGMKFADFRKQVLGIDSTRTIDTNEFKWVIIKVDSSIFRTNEFQFRFRNYASLSGEHNLGATVNCDHWNIDYVYLNDGRSATDSDIRDLAFVKMPSSILKTYQAVPWSHYNAVQKSDLYKEIFYLRNNNKQVSKLSTSEIVFRDVQSGKGIDSVYLTGDNVPAFSNHNGISWTFDKDPFFELNQDELQFEVELRFDADDDYKQNNSVISHFNYSNYYAYDDGSAESAYSIESSDARVAYLYQSAIADTLKGVSMYFLPTNPEGEGAQSINLFVWSERDGFPNEVLYEQTDTISKYSTNLNKFVTYVFETPLAVKGKFFIGWMQKTNKHMNVGFDVNTYGNSKLFYTIYSDWENTSFKGSLMMRPLFGSISPNDISSNVSNNNLIVYPNPANSFISFKGINSEVYSHLQIYSTMGKLVVNQTINSSSIDISFLPDGVYVLSITSENSAPQVTRLVITH